MIEKISYEITQMKKHRKKALIIIVSILVILSLLFTWWASVRIQENKLRKTIIMKNFIGKEFAYASSIVEENAGWIRFNTKGRIDFTKLAVGYDKQTLDFKNFVLNDKTVILSHKHSEFALCDDGETRTIDYWNTQKEYEYSINISFLGEITLSFNNNDYVVTVNDKNEPIQVAKDGQIYKIENIAETKIE